MAVICIINNKLRIRPRQLRPRAIVMYMAMCVVSEVIYRAAAQVFAPIPSCTSELSSFAGIVCSGDAVTGKVAHCVLDEHFQAGLVCSEWRFVTAGSCPQYITQYSGIDDFACIGNECPGVIYKSYEVYKYPACLNSSLYITEPTTTQTDATSKGSTRFLSMCPVNTFRNVNGNCNAVLETTSGTSTDVPPAEGPVHTVISLVLLKVILVIVGFNFAVSIILLYRFSKNDTKQRHESRTPKEQSTQGIIEDIEMGAEGYESPIIPTERPEMKVYMELS